nr:hypothetical protein [Tanacetum cinerariifolium]
MDPPAIHDDTSLILTETPTLSPITSTIPSTAPTTHYTSSFIHTNSTDDDIPNTPPSLTHEIPRVKLIPHGRSYHYHPNGPVHMMTARKRVGPLPTHRLTVRHSIDYSSSYYFTFDDLSRDSPSDSSSEMPSDSSLDALSDSSSGHLSSDHSSPALPSGMRSSHQLCSSVLSISHSPATITERPSHSSSTGPSQKGSGEPYSEPDIDPKIQAVIDKCIAYADALRAEGINARVVVQTAAREEVEMSAKSMVEVRVDRVMHPVVAYDIHDPTIFDERHAPKH